VIRVERGLGVDEAMELERAAGLGRSRPEVARRLAVAEAFAARSEAGALLGAGTLALWSDSADDARPALAWIGGMVVRPEARRRGVARAILLALLARAEERGARVVGLDASEAGRPLYASEGFVELGRSTRWARDRPRAEAQPSARHAVHPISVSEAMEVAAYDEPRFGARRMPLLMALLRDHPWHAFLARDRVSGEVSGYAMASERAMGPLYAEDAEAAAALLAAGELSGAVPKLLAVDANHAATALLRAAGYAPELSVARMTLRGAPLPGARAREYGVAAWALG
jgi:GNAT superfamily N-acetyltransferase